MEQLLTEINAIDKLLFEEITEIHDFEDNIAKIEDELTDEEKILAKLHNTSRLTIIAIKHFHTLIRKIDQSKKLQDHDKNLMRHYLDRIAMNLIQITGSLDKLEQDEHSGKKIRNYCDKVSGVIKEKLLVLKDKFNNINQ